jgi:hypothetical protein
MKRFQKGDFAFAGRHLVIVREVCGPTPEHGLDYAYLIERVDREPFEISGRRRPRIHAAQRHLRQLGGTPRWKSRVPAHRQPSPRSR